MGAALNAALYLRVSTDEQAEEGVSLDAQEARLQEYCARRGMVAIGTYIDPGVSGSTPFAERPAGQRLLSDLRARKAQAVVVAKVDRLARDLRELLAVEAEWTRAGIALHLLDMDVDTSTAAGRLQLQIMGAFAEFELKRIRERTKEGLARLRMRGLRTGGIPYGMRVQEDGCTLEPDPDEQVIIGIIQNLHRNGMSFRALAKALNEKEIPARGTEWHKTTVHGVFHGTRKPKHARENVRAKRVPMDMVLLKALAQEGVASADMALRLGVEESRILRALDAIEDPSVLMEQYTAVKALKATGHSYVRIAEAWGVSRDDVKDLVDGTGVLPARAWRKIKELAKARDTGSTA
jgi:DNA invertase Pin-like site-specific DNA recombinase